MGELSVKPSLPPSKVFKIMRALLEPSAFCWIILKNIKNSPNKADPRERIGSRGPSGKLQNYRMITFN